MKRSADYCVCFRSDNCDSFVVKLLYIHSPDGTTVHAYTCNTKCNF